MDKIKVSFLERAIEFFSPEMALKRARYSAALGSVRSYDAAKKGRRTSDMSASPQSANAAIFQSLETLRGRSRDADRNNGYHEGANDRISNNVVGSGLIPSPVGVDEKEKEQIMSLWMDFADTCDFDEQGDFYALQWLVMRSVANSGECLAVRRIEKGKKPIPFSVQIIEADYIDSSRNETLSDGGYIMQGIEYNSKGKRVAYWLFRQHPGELVGQYHTSERILTKNILHQFFKKRPGQNRGVPFGASTMLKLKDFEDYESAQLVRQQVAACFAVFVHDINGDAVGDAKSGKAEDNLERVEPGMIEHLPPGKTVSFAAPATTEGYESFSKKILQAVAAGRGMTYEALTSDLSNVNFSSGRMGWLEFHRTIVTLQNTVMIPMFCKGVWNWFVEGCNLMGHFDSKPKSAWTPPRREMIDPIKETNGLVKALRSGITSWSEVARAQGWDADELMNEIAKEREKMKTLGIVFEGNMTDDPLYISAKAAAAAAEKKAVLTKK